MHAPRWLNDAVSRVEGSRAADRLVDRLRPLARMASSGRRGELLRGEWLGHALHPLATDLPLGCWIGSTVLDVVSPRRGARSSRRLVGAGLLFVPLSATSGMADWATLDDVPRRRVGAVHAVGNTLVALLYLTSWRRRRAGRQASGIGFGLMGGSLAIVTGYLGGHLSFGRGSGVEPRGLDVREPVDVIVTDDLLTLAEVADELGVLVDRVRVLVDEGLLTPAVGGQAMLFRRGDIVAVRLLGG